MDESKNISENQLKLYEALKKLAEGLVDIGYGTREEVLTEMKKRLQGILTEDFIEENARGAVAEVLPKETPTKKEKLSKSIETGKKNKSDYNKPIKPELSEYELNEDKLKILTRFQENCEKKSKIILWVVFILLTVTSVAIIIFKEYHKGIIVLTTVGASILVWSFIPSLISIITKKDMKDLLFENTKDNNISDIHAKYLLYSSAMQEYKNKNSLYERALRRATWSYWLSLNPKDFEKAVGSLFADKGYRVFLTPGSGDHGVDLFLHKDDKKYVVQCKTYKRSLGPNAARDLYGTMYANEANEAFLVAPSGFSDATKDFCEDKPIHLMDIDDLTKMTYDFENYTPYWIETATSVDDLFKGLGKIRRSNSKKRTKRL